MTRATPVIQVDVGHLEPSGEVLRIHRVAMVLGGDGDPAGGKVLHRMIDPPVAELQLESPDATGQGEDLMAQADAEER